MMGERQAWWSRIVRLSGQESNPKEEFCSNVLHCAIYNLISALSGDFDERAECR